MAGGAGGLVSGASGASGVEGGEGHPARKARGGVDTLAGAALVGEGRAETGEDSGGEVLPSIWMILK